MSGKDWIVKDKTINCTLAKRIYQRSKKGDDMFFEGVNMSVNLLVGFRR